MVLLGENGLNGIKNLIIKQLIAHIYQLNKDSLILLVFSILSQNLNLNPGSVHVL